MIFIWDTSPRCIAHTHFPPITACHLSPPPPLPPHSLLRLVGSSLYKLLFTLSKPAPSSHPHLPLHHVPLPSSRSSSTHPPPPLKPLHSSFIFCFYCKALPGKKHTHPEISYLISCRSLEEGCAAKFDIASLLLCWLPIQNLKLQSEIMGITSAVINFLCYPRLSSSGSHKRGLLMHQLTLCTANIYTGAEKRRDSRMLAENSYLCKFIYEYIFSIIHWIQ